VGSGGARNSPCSCGSGKKYKLCCGQSVQALQQYRPDDRASVLRALEDFVQDHVDLEKSAGVFFESLPDEERTRALKLALVYDSFMTWVILDDPGAGAVAGFLRRYGSRLSPGQRRYLDALRATELRLYDVLEVELDAGLRLRDRLERTVIAVVEERATRSIVPGDVLAVRVIAGKAPGTLELEHPVLPITRLDAERIVKELRSIRGRVRRKLGADAAPAFLKIETPIIVNDWWMDRLDAAAEFSTRGSSAFRTAEGDPVAFHAVTFAIRDARALLDRLRGDEAFIVEPEVDQLLWVDPNHHRILGTIRIRDGVLRVEVMSLQRAGAFRAKLMALAGDVASFVAIEPIDPAQAGARGEAPEEPSIPAELREQIIAEALGKHYASWPDIPVPALGGLTPREAAKDPRERKQLITLLRNFDAASERERKDGKPAYDFAPLWRELGLERSRLLRRGP
jgi:hypothetical protein